MMLHDKIIPGHFLLDYKRDLLNCPPQGHKLDMYPGFNYHHDEQQPTYSPSPAGADGEVLDLSRRCDSVETRKTPSPYNSAYSYGTNSPSTHCSSPSTAPPAQAPSTSSAPSLPTQDLPSLYPLYYSGLKPELLSPPPAVPARSLVSSQLPLPLFATNSSMLLQHAIKTSPNSDDQKCTSPPRDAASLLYPNILNAATTGGMHSGKATRPFNAYPRDPALVAAHFSASDVLFDKASMERYSNFRKRALDDLRETNGGHRIVTNPKMRRTNTRRSQNSECEERAGESDSSSVNGAAPGDHPANDTNNNTSSSEQRNENSETASNSGGSNVKDEAYYERRRKNNAAAKKSRDRRRIKEDEIAIRAAYLERQNIELLCQIEALKKQLEIYTKV